MESPLEMPKLDHQRNVPAQLYQNFFLPASTSSAFKDDIIDLSQMTFDDDENWLLESSSKSDVNLQDWFSGAKETIAPKRNFDTRTFTRPKKRTTRSIEEYNEELFRSDSSDVNGAPLHFDLTQPNSYFDNILAMTTQDSFMNTSPPSLVNSMCSSTFATLMDSSFIKNDPVLREIRDTDYTASILQNESEPYYQSMTGSVSSLTSDPESFVKKITGKSFRDECEDSDEDTTLKAKNTYRKLKSDTFRKADVKNGIRVGFQRKSSDESSDTVSNSTIIVENPKVNSTVAIDSPGESKRLLSRRQSPSYDLNRLSYAQEKRDLLNSTFPVDNSKRNSLGSNDSSENLDYMSVSSGSSKSSNKIPSLDGINAIVEMQERSLRQIESTPKQSQKSKMFWENNISPISGRNSDPELSSSDVTPAGTIKKQKSLANLMTTAVNRTITRPQPIIKKSLKTNLNSMGHTLKGSYTSLRPTNRNLPIAPPLDTTISLPKRTAQVENQVAAESTFIRPQQPKASGLPRPVTGIPRTTSKIPGPRIPRPLAQSAGQQRR